MPKPFAIIDVPGVCYKALFTTGGLTHEGAATGVLFGFFKQIVTIQKELSPFSFVFCFDGKGSYRRMQMPSYKQPRRDKRDKATEEERKALKAAYRQIELLKGKILPFIGFRNILCQRGLEADDMIAAACKKIVAKDDRAIIISNDKDMLQLLGKSVSIWYQRERRLYFADDFTREYGISPSQWSDVLAIAGCTSDNVQGIKGIGIKTAVKFLSGNLSPKSAAHQKIVDGNNIWKRNLPLVRLPHEKTVEKAISIVRDRVSKPRWDRVMSKYGMESLMGFGGANFPIFIRRKK